MVYSIKTSDTLVGRYFTSFNSFLIDVEDKLQNRDCWTYGAEASSESARAALWRIRENSNKEIQELFMKIQTYQRNASRKYVRYLAPVGIEPCVPNYLIGLPNDMYNIQITKRLQKQIDILLVYNFESKYSKEELEKLYRILAPLLILLKDKNFHTNINIVVPLEDATVPIVINIVNNNKMDILAMQAITDIDSFMRGLCFFYSRCLGHELSMTLGHPVKSDVAIDGDYNCSTISDIGIALGTDYLTINCAMLVDIINELKAEMDYYNIISRIVEAIKNKCRIPMKRDLNCILRRI